MNLNKTLEEYKKENIYPFHMPGHKRRIAKNEYSIDMTEVEGVDDLHDPEGAIAEDQDRIKNLYGSDESYILVGGSTVGNLAAIYASTKEGDTIIIPRNAHKSVYNAAMLRHLKIEYLYPEIDEYGIYNPCSLDEVKYAIEKYNPAAMVIISPTYEGRLADIHSIADLCHENNVILIVDQAHGAHLGFDEHFPGSAVEYADITIQSLHKTLPALTQTALLHKKGNNVDSRRIRAALDIFETSSPSYVLMNSVSDCVDILENSTALFTEYVENLHNFRTFCGELNHIKLLVDNIDKMDMGKLILSTKTTNITGTMLAKILREKYKIETEMASFAYVIAMTSIMDSKEGFERLKKALKEIDQGLNAGNIDIPYKSLIPKRKMEIFEAKSGEEKLVDLKESVGEISATMVCLYPPGAPIVVPGEEITKEALEVIAAAKSEGIHVTGVNEDSISVVN
ncbi:MAG: aminotransferase class V-fold PLP-dependent enzyme [Pseudobutyrivibrio sp.]|nr:aminotransferase class V-fold PLP-dependent enzyme [Pseudobutyrivibrio sp.]